MKERPILFSAPMVRALLAGTKTQTRRVVALPRSRSSFVLVRDHTAHTWWPYQSDDGESDLCDDGCEHPYASPYGLPGDRLWVRENGWERPERTPKMMREGADTWEPYYFDADGYDHPTEAAELKAWGFKRRPSIHMPRWASRILLEVTEVRVERLQDISEEDALAEGIDAREVIVETRYEAGQHREIWAEQYLHGTWPCQTFETAAEAYADLWDSLGGDWAANPWVWAVSLRRVS